MRKLGAILEYRHALLSARHARTYNPSWLKLVRTSAGAGDGFEGLAEVVGQGVGGGDALPSGLDLDGAIAAGGLHELPDRPAGLRLFHTYKNSTSKRPGILLVTKNSLTRAAERILADEPHR